MSAAPMIELAGVTKRFGAFTAVDRVDLTVKAGEFLTLLGPSGCGKTTLLRLLSGFELPDEGSICVDGHDVTHLPPYRRDLNQVFQSYALFPHLTVRENIAFGLRMQRCPAAEIARRVAEAVELVALGGLEERRPHQLSGGQRQRVALARAIVPRPKVLLLDEPLSALDAKLRQQMQIELKHLQRRLGLTFVFVTHDQEEALTMSDRIAVVNRGRIEQLATAGEIYHRPATAFVADFVGETNLLHVRRIGAGEDRVRVQAGGGLELTVAAAAWPDGAERALLSIRPEKIHVTRQLPPAEICFTAVVTEEIFKGALDHLTLSVGPGLTLQAVVANESALLEAIHAGDRVHCGLHPDDIVVLPADAPTAG